MLADTSTRDTVEVTTAPNAGEADLTVLGRALADTSRATILTALMTGTAWTVGELAKHAGIARSTASEHITHLAAAGLVHVTRQGRHAYVTLSGPDTAAALETLGLLAPRRPTVASLRGQRHARELEEGRTCYRHLAGRLGVDLADSLMSSGFITSAYELTTAGRGWFTSVGVDPEAVRGVPALRPCMDWTQRRHHLAGPLADRLARAAFEQGWIERGTHPRSVRLTGQGARVLIGLVPTP